MDGAQVLRIKRRQRTLRTAVTVRGFGYWSGEDVSVELRPAPPGQGVIFVRRDLQPAQRIPARVAHRVESPRRTSLTNGVATVEMVEHILAGLSGLQVDNCEVWVDRPEMPGFDGSSAPVVAAIRDAGLREQEEPRGSVRVTRTVRLGDAEAWIEASPTATPGLHLTYELDYGPGPIGHQVLSLTVDEDSFERELAASRTFLLEEEAAWLRQRGLGSRVTLGDLLVFGPHGPLENHLRFPDECVRHKTLDLVGDLALAGCDVDGRIVAYRSGHRLNAQLVFQLLTLAGEDSSSRRCA